MNDINRQKISSATPSSIPAKLINHHRPTSNSETLVELYRVVNILQVTFNIPKDKTIEFKITNKTANTASSSSLNIKPLKDAVTDFINAPYTRAVWVDTENINCTPFDDTPPVITDFKKLMNSLILNYTELAKDYISELENTESKEKLQSVITKLTEMNEHLKNKNKTLFEEIDSLKNKQNDSDDWVSKGDFNKIMEENEALKKKLELAEAVAAPPPVNEDTISKADLDELNRLRKFKVKVDGVLEGIIASEKFIPMKNHEKANIDRTKLDAFDKMEKLVNEYIGQTQVYSYVRASFIGANKLKELDIAKSTAVNLRTEAEIMYVINSNGLKIHNNTSATTFADANSDKILELYKKIIDTNISKENFYKRVHALYSKKQRSMFGTSLVKQKVYEVETIKEIYAEFSS